MKKRLLWFLMLLPSALWAQNGAVTGYCVLGATSAQVSGLSSTNTLQGVIPGCTISVYYTGTSTIVPSNLIYSNATGTVLGNPFTANTTTGQWLFYAAQTSNYDVVLSGGTGTQTYPSPVTLTGLSAGGSGGSGGGVTAVTASLPLQSSGGSAPNITLEAGGVSNSYLQNDYVIVNGTTCTLGSTGCTPSPTTINGAPIPASMDVVATNSSSQLVAASAYNIGHPIECIATTGTANVYGCSTTVPFTLAGNVSLYFNVDVTNTGISTLAVNGGTAYPMVLELAGSFQSFAGGELGAGQWILVHFDGSRFQTGDMVGTTVTSPPGSGCAFANFFLLSTNSTAKLGGCAPMDAGATTSGAIEYGSPSTTSYYNHNFYGGPTHSGTAAFGGGVTVYAGLGVGGDATVGGEVVGGTGFQTSHSYAGFNLNGGSGPATSSACVMPSGDFVAQGYVWGTGPASTAQAIYMAFGCTPGLNGAMAFNIGETYTGTPLNFSINNTSAGEFIVQSVATSPSTSPICPNGTGGAFTTSGCTGGGGGGISGNTSGYYVLANSATTSTSSGSLADNGSVVSTTEAFTAPTINNVIYLGNTGSDIGAQINAAVTALASTCLINTDTCGTIVIKPGSYTMSTTATVSGNINIIGSGAQATVITCTVNADCIYLAPPFWTGSGIVNNAGARVSSFTIFGNGGSSQNGIHSLGINGWQIYDLTIDKFSGASASCMFMADDSTHFSEENNIWELRLGVYSATTGCTKAMKFSASSATYDSFGYNNILIHCSPQAGQYCVSLEGYSYLYNGNMTLHVDIVNAGIIFHAQDNALTGQGTYPNTSAMNINIETEQNIGTGGVIFDITSAANRIYLQGALLNLSTTTSFGTPISGSTLVFPPYYSSMNTLPSMYSQNLAAGSVDSFTLFGLCPNLSAGGGGSCQMDVGTVGTTDNSLAVKFNNIGGTGATTNTGSIGLTGDTAGITIGHLGAVTYPGTVQYTLVPTATSFLTNYTQTPYAGTGSTSQCMALFFAAGIAAPTTWNTGGCYMGWNIKSTFTGNVMDVHFNGGASIWNVNYLGNNQASLYSSVANCSSSAAPAACSAAPDGSVVVAAAATTVTVNTTAVTANSQILLQFDSSLGTKLGVTCNTTYAVPYVTARTAATSFVITVGIAPITNPACYSYSIIN